MAALFCSFQLSDDVEDKGEDNESDGDPLGGLSQLSVQRTALILGGERLRDTADSAGKTCALARLEHNDEDNSDCAEELENGDSELHIK